MAALLSLKGTPGRGGALQKKLEQEKQEAISKERTGSSPRPSRRASSSPAAT
jgi:hypothetical protein